MPLRLHLLVGRRQRLLQGLNLLRGLRLHQRLRLLSHLLRLPLDRNPNGAVRSGCHLRCLRNCRLPLGKQCLVAEFLLAVQLPVHLVQPLHYVPDLPLVHSPRTAPPSEPGELVRDQLERNPFRLLG